MTEQAAPVVDDDADYLMTMVELAEYTGIPCQTLHLLREPGIGPRSALVGDRIMYQRTEVDDWRGRRKLRSELKSAITRVTDAILDVAEVFDQVV